MLSVHNLTVAFPTKSTENTVVHNISFELNTNEILGIVGESGSGKSVTALSILRLHSKQTCKISGNILFDQQSLTGATEKKLCKIRGNRISMIFQEPMSALNPTLTCGYQVLEILTQHQKISKRNAQQEVISLFRKVKLPNPEVIFNKYPHQLSGGQQQRVMIAMSIACKPDILIADEPTTALDASTQTEIVKLLKELQQSTQMSILFITHDLALVSQISDRVLVMQHGTIVESGYTKTVFQNPQQRYTQALINSRPNPSVRYKRLPTVDQFINNTVSYEVYSDKERKSFHDSIYSHTPLLTLKNVKKYFKSPTKYWFQKPNMIKAVDDVSFSIYKGETVGLVGESGCGKTTLGRSILQLETITSGEIFYKGKDLSKISTKELKNLRKEIQIIFQDPFSSLNPKINIGKALLEPMQKHGILNSNKERKDYIYDLLERVGLKKEHYNRYPHEFSGGQRQRIGIARSIVLKPQLIICDESVSALDVSVQAQILNLLNELKADYQFTYLFISHDLLVVKHMADQLIVMKNGKIEELGDADQVYNNPQSEYTKMLIEA